MPTKNKILEETSKMQSLHEDILQDTKNIQKLRKNIMNFKAKTDTLNNFYQNEWSEYRNVLKSSKEVHFSILGEDLIYESIYEQYEEVKKLLKECSEYIQ